MTTGYAKMRNINYKKNDEPFISTTTVYPIFDVSSSSSTTSAESPIDEGPSCLPVITHFASVMTDCRDIKVEPSEMARMRAADKIRLQKIADEKTKGNGNTLFFGKPKIIHQKNNCNCSLNLDRRREIRQADSSEEVSCFTVYIR